MLNSCLDLIFHLFRDLKEHEHTDKTYYNKNQRLNCNEKCINYYVRILSCTKNVWKNVILHYLEIF